MGFKLIRASLLLYTTVSVIGMSLRYKNTPDFGGMVQSKMSWFCPFIAKNRTTATAVLNFLCHHNYVVIHTFKTAWVEFPGSFAHFIASRSYRDVNGAA